ncbi:MAG TPA: L-rhamnose mutarotase [Chitinophagaceae bacterium]|nr:L-rhamnose mutarotase [Chitinophagaceae bacterium]
MQRIGFAMKMFEGCAEEYKRRHDALWPRLEALLKETGIKDYTIFLDEHTNTLFASMEVTDASRLDELPKHAVMQEWWSYMKDIMETNEDNSPVVVPLKEVFYLP